VERTGVAVEAAPAAKDSWRSRRISKRPGIFCDHKSALHELILGSPFKVQLKGRALFVFSVTGRLRPYSVTQNVAPVAGPPPPPPPRHRCVGEHQQTH